MFHTHPSHLRIAKHMDLTVDKDKSLDIHIKAFKFIESV